MSRRRKKKAGSEPREAEETKEKERPKKEKAPETKIRKTRKADMKKMLLYSVVIAAVFFTVGFFVGPVITGCLVTTSGNTDQLIFISPPGCANCEEMEPLVKEVADTLGVSFTKTGFSQQLENPGFVLVYNDNFLGVSGFDSEASLKEQICLITENEEICEESNELTPPEPPTPEFPKRDQPENTDIKTFLDSGAEICYDDGKPVIRMYASSRCGYCMWNKPIYEKVVKEYMDQGKIVAYLWEDGKNILSDEQETIPPEEEALRQQYGFSGVPAFIFGCKYYRSGASFSRVENGEALEETELRTVIEDLLGG